MKRRVQPELLDTLPPEDPRAAHSRRDLHRINAWMRGHAIMARALENNLSPAVPRHITELGAGDGKFLLAVAQKIAPRWPAMTVTLLDRQKNVSGATLAGFAQCGWRAEGVVTDVFAWPEISETVVVVNLFLHHFEEVQLAALLRLISARAKLFIALEPRRSRWPFFCSRLLWAIGCNAVTRHDAAVSVRAGFSGQELSALWPEKHRWQIQEKSIGAFSHLFIARKLD
jgi:hypothetical protein